jgi:hypothetical protein
VRRVFALAALSVGCAHAPVAQDKPADGKPPDAVVTVADEPGLQVQAEPADAELVIDGQSYGKVSELPQRVTLKPGIYQVSLKRDGFQTWRAEVSVGEKTELLKVALVKR